MYIMDLKTENPPYCFVAFYVTSHFILSDFVIIICDVKYGPVTYFVNAFANVLNRLYQMTLLDINVSLNYP